MISLIESKKGKYKSAKDADHMPAMDERDNMRKEIANESEAVKKIILHLKKALQVTDAEKELEMGSWWDHGSHALRGSGQMGTLTCNKPRRVEEIWSQGVPGNVDRGFGSGMMLVGVCQCLLVFILLYGPVDVQIRSIEVVLGGMNTTSSDPACPEGEWSDRNIDPRRVRERWGFSSGTVFGGQTPLQAAQHALRGSGQMGTWGVPVNVDRGIGSGAMTWYYKTNASGPVWMNTIPSGPACSEAGWPSGHTGILSDTYKNLGMMINVLEPGPRVSQHSDMVWIGALFPILYGPVPIYLSAGEEVSMSINLPEAANDVPSAPK
ncbi:hypothetical protein F5J12DRAFT_787396 [Pisolithus orientalis]|uniref:uncharacterized protein n=1 Tax=Pisolithus orientalis TaxID=936130 RepID=UPI0022248F4F|nr:uncharacterized protein F5J12DRAFT_787396 [Pisolithus orientalis]KAI5985436.1 hypothetical protein F5J12DRAFT_787396 [Pisolithus orientalis]